MPAADEGDWEGIDGRAAEVISQAHRSADWLGTVPLPRLLAHEAAIVVEAYAIVVELDRATRAMASRMCTPGLGPECPPASVVPPRLAPHAVGAQLRVFADQFARVVGVYGVDGAADQAALRELADRCLALRNRPRWVTPTPAREESTAP